MASLSPSWKLGAYQAFDFVFVLKLTTDLTSLSGLLKYLLTSAVTVPTPRLCYAPERAKKKKVLNTKF